MTAISNWAASGQVLFLGNLWKNGIKGEKDILKDQNYGYIEDVRAFFSQCCTTC